MMHHIRTILFTIILIAIGSIPSVAEQANDKQTELEALYQQIDEAIEQYPLYVAGREKQINSFRNLFLSESSLEKKMLMAEQLFALYKPYKNDSAIHYAEVCINIAESLHRPDLAGRYRSLEARQCSGVGMYVEALNLLKKVDRSALGRQELTNYYEAWMHVCGEIGSHSYLPNGHQIYYGMQDAYRDSVLAMAKEDSEEFLHLKMDVLSARQQYQEALKVSDNWISMVSEGTHESAFAAFYRSVVYGKLDNHNQVRYWLGRSALDDIKCAVQDQAALIMLAEHLSEDGDMDRAYRYICFGKDCNLAFHPTLRNYQVNSVINVINKTFKESQDTNRFLTILASVVSILLLAALLFILLLLRKKQ